nr:hypothetical protein [Abalone asfa-like virus]
MLTKRPIKKINKKDIMADPTINLEYYKQLQLKLKSIATETMKLYKYLILVNSDIRAALPQLNDFVHHEGSQKIKDLYLKLVERIDKALDTETEIFKQTQLLDEVQNLNKLVKLYEETL